MTRENQVTPILCTASIIVNLLTGYGGENKPANSEKTGTVVEETERDNVGDVEGDGQLYKLNFGRILTENDPFHRAYLKWAEAISEKTGGELQIEIYPSSQLRVEESTLEQMKQGTSVGQQVDAARLGNYVNEFSVLLALYFLENMDKIKELTDSPIIAEWEKKLEDEHNIKVISFGSVQGYRSVYANKKVVSPGEMKGLQIHTTGVPAWVVGIDSLGCKAVSLAYGGIHNGIQTEVVDDCKLSYIAANNLKTQEVAKYTLETQHIYQMDFMAYSVEWFNSLPESCQRVPTDERNNTGLEVSKQMQKDSDAAKQAMINSGTEHIPADQVDIVTSRKASQEVYDKLNLDGVREAVHKELGREIIK